MSGPYRVLVAIESCVRDLDKHHAQRNTWLKDLCVTEKKFFIGGAGFSPLEDEIFLGADIDDSYEALSLKTQAMCRWALAHNFDWMFKCDTDTVLNPWEFIFSWNHEDYLGGENADVNVKGFAPGRIEFCSGGAGYWLSKKALTIVAEADSIKASAEDVFVANALSKYDIKPTFHPGYRWRPGAIIDKEVVTLHLSSALQKKYQPLQMYEAYKQVKEVVYGNIERGEFRASSL